MPVGTAETGARRWVISALDLLFPAFCPVCRTALDAGRRDPLCGTCWSGIERLRPPWCAGCGLPFTAQARVEPPVPVRLPAAHGHGQAPMGLEADGGGAAVELPAATGVIRADRCPGCMLRPSPFAWARAGGRYAGVLREVIHAFKFGGRQSLARPLGDLVLEQVGPDVPDDVDALVPVPLAPTRERERGFNQATLLAERIGGRLAIPVHPRWLRRTRATQVQADLSATERQANVRGAFRASPRAAGRHVIIVDDVLTTGATVAECARALRAAGTSRVGVLTVARVV